MLRYVANSLDYHYRFLAHLNPYLVTPRLTTDPVIRRRSCGQWAPHSPVRNLLLVLESLNPTHGARNKFHHGEKQPRTPHQECGLSRSSTVVYPYRLVSVVM